MTDHRMILMSDEEAAALLRGTSQALLRKVQDGEPIGEYLMAATFGIILETLATMVERLGDLCQEK